MLAMLPLVFFLTALVYYAAREEWRSAVIKGAITTGLATVLNTELLSLFDALAIVPLGLAWVVEIAVVASGIWIRRNEIAELVSRLKHGHPERLVTVFLIPITAIALVTAVVALVAPPNTFDSMTYHMARVAHWSADQTVAFYPTNIVRQLYSPPWSEYAIAQLQILSSGDQTANLVQWFCMVCSVAGVSLIAKQLGATTRGQLLASLSAVTLPMGILQASSTQTDYAMSLWLVCCIAATLTFVNTRTWSSAFWLGSSLGLALLTKGTGYLFAAPLVLMLSTWMLISLRRDLLATGALMVALPLLINSGMWIRNAAMFHNPLAPASETAMLANATHAPAAVLSNVLRDSVLQFGTPLSPVNQRLQSAIVKVHTQVLHIDATDRRTTFGDAKFAVNPSSLDEDYAGNPLQGLGAIFAIIAAAWAWRARRLPALYSAGLVAGFVFFAAYLKWQPWHSRLELPLLVASCPLVGLTIGSRLGNVGLAIMGSVLLIGAAPFVVDNQTRPMLGFGLGQRSLPEDSTIFNTSRADLYFVKYATIEDPYRQIAAEAHASNCRNIALWERGNDWEYPLWALTREEGARFDNVMVTNESSWAPARTTHPCLLVTTKPDPPTTVCVEGVDFTQEWLTEGIGLYKPSG